MTRRRVDAAFAALLLIFGPMGSTGTIIAAAALWSAMTMLVPADHASATDSQDGTR